MTKQKGFTTLELGVALSAGLVLILMAVSSAQVYKRGLAIEKAKVKVEALQTAIREFYFINCDILVSRTSYPITLQELIDDGLIAPGFTLDSGLGSDFSIGLTLFNSSYSYTGSIWLTASDDFSPEFLRKRLGVMPTYGGTNRGTNVYWNFPLYKNTSRFKGEQYNSPIQNSFIRNFGDPSECHHGI